MSNSDSNNLVEILQIRAEWLRKIRRFFDERDFLEVQTPVLSIDTVVDRYIDPIPVQVDIQGQGKRQLWMQTSPEFCMKRLLCGGAQAIYEITPVFRNGECGDRHHIEFTMLEWYRVGDDYQAGMDLLDEFSRELLLRPAAKRMTYEQALRDLGGVNSRGEVGNDELNQVMAEKVEPALAELGAVIIYDWPESMSALAKTRNLVSDQDAAANASEASCRVAERFELYVDGIELANGYHELTDAKELRQRNRRINQLRRQDGKPELPENSQLLREMDCGFPDCAGVALGFERLLMLATGARNIGDVLPLSSDLS